MEKPHTTSRDFFLYLLTLITLFAGVIALNALLFAYIDIGFPSILERYTYYNTQIRSSMATLIVMFPIYLSLTWFLHKDLMHFPEKKDLGIRKFIIHLTLFITAIVIIVDLITLINTFLNGELTARFILKILTVFVTTGSVFAYYMWDLRRELRKGPSRLLASLASAVVLCSIIGGFFLIGSPATQRKYRLDEQRVMDLENVHYQVISYYQSKKRLPDTLTDLQNDVTGYVLPADPQPGQKYEYVKLGDTRYELCATFALPTDTNNSATTDYYGPRPYGLTWEHSAGRDCFSRQIDPELINPAIPKPPIYY